MFAALQTEGLDGTSRSSASSQVWILGVGTVTSVGPPSRVSRTPVQPGRAVRPPGADNREILSEISMSGAFDDLVSKKVIVEPVT